MSDSASQPGDPKRDTSRLGTPWTVLRLITWTTGYFTQAGLDEPRLSAEVLLAYVLGVPRLQLYVRFERVVEPPHLGAYRELVKRVREGEPIAHLTGTREFYSLAFEVTPDVLIPRPETELLVDVALEAAKAAAGGPLRLWDVCTGSGCVAVAAAKRAENLTVLATDISPPAVAVARRNVERHKLGGRVRVEVADLLALPESAGDLAPFDVITANPPYVSEATELPKVVRREPPLALYAGPRGLEVIERLVRDAPARLRAGGRLATEMGMGQAAAVYDLLNHAGCWQDIRILKDAAGIERVAVAVRT